MNITEFNDHTSIPSIHRDNIFMHPTPIKMQLILIHNKRYSIYYFLW
jgi:hypothetical protein